MLIGNGVGGGLLPNHGGSFNVNGANADIIINANASGPSSTNGIIFNGSQTPQHRKPAARPSSMPMPALVNLYRYRRHRRLTNILSTAITQSWSTALPSTLTPIINLSAILSSSTPASEPALSPTPPAALVLSSNLIYQGQALTIIAVGSISASSAINIDLTGIAGKNGGNGGSLNIIAGYDFTPLVTHISPVSGLFTLNGPSGDGGDVNLSNVTINTGTNQASANGGNVLVVSVGTTSATGGTIALGSITTSALGGGTASGGSVTLIGGSGGGGISVGAITTTGSAAGGNVSIYSAAPVPSATVQSTNGILSGTFTPGTFAGSLTVSSAINAGTGTVTLQTGTAGALVTGPGVISGSTVNLTTDTTGTITGSGAISATNLNLASGSGAITGINTNAGTISATSTGALGLSATAPTANITTAPAPSPSAVPATSLSPTATPMAPPLLL